MPELRIDRVDSNPGTALFGAIDFYCRLRNDGVRRLLVDSRADVYFRSNQPLLLGQAFQMTPESEQELGRNGEGSVGLRFCLNPLSLQQIEELRSARPLDLELKVHLSGTNLDPQEARGNPSFRTVATQSHRIEKSRWVEEFLPALGLSAYESWELRFPSVVVHDALKDETERLRRAIRDYNIGEYADAFKDCREMVELLKARRAELDLDGAVGAEEWGRAENYLSTALHARTGRTIVRADAEFAISLTQAIHRRVSHALATPKRQDLVSIKPRKDS